MSSPNPHDYRAIQNTLARYCIALDTKDWKLLDTVFTQDVAANYPFNPELQGLKPLSEAIQNRLQHIKSQHALTTQTIALSPLGDSATATTYFSGVHFGLGKWAGQQVTAWGKYVDELVLLPTDAGGPDVPGVSGRWLVSRRRVEFTARLGEEGVMKGEEA